MRYKSIFLLQSIFLSTLMLGGQAYGREGDVDATGLWREAVGLYTQESDDYIDTFSETLSELKTLRDKVLRDRFEERITNLESILSSSNSEILAELEKYAKANGVEALDDSLLMRLSQLHFERANFDLSRQMKEYEGQVNQFQSGQRSVAPLPPAPDYSKTIQYAQILLKNYPVSPLRDKALYLLGYCTYDQGEAEKAAAFYALLITDYPFSELAAESRWRLAEEKFDVGDYSEALKQYEFLSKGKNTFSQKALYKEGAVYYAQKRYVEAAKTFLQLLKISRDRLGADPEAATLYDEAIDYLAYLKSKNVPLSISEDDEGLITQRLADVFERHQEEEKARQTYLSFVTSHGVSKWSPRFMGAVIDSYVDHGQIQKAQDIRGRFVHALSPGSPFWKKYRSDFSTTIETQDLYEANVLASAEYFAEQARASKRAADYKMAIDYYGKFTAEYPWSPLRNQALYEKAELEYFAGLFDQASGDYQKVASAVDNVDYREDAAYGYLLSEAKRIKFPLQDQESLQPLRGADGALAPATELTPSDKIFLDAASFYTSKVDSGSRRQTILYRMSGIYFRHNKFAKARECLESLLKERENSALSTNAVRLIALSYDLEGNWGKVLETNRRLLSFAPTADGSGSDMDPVLHVASQSLTLAQHLEGAGKKIEAAAEYEKYAIGFPKAADAAYALFHGASLYRELAQFDSSDKNFKKLIKEYSKSEYLPQAKFFMAANQESLIRFDEAVESYEKFGKEFPKNFLSTQAFLNAATLRRGMGQYERAAQDLSEYNHRVVDDEVTFQVAELYQKASKFGEAEKIYNGVIKHSGNKDIFVRGHFELAQMKALNRQPTDLKGALRECEYVTLAADKFKSALSALARYGAEGCRYMATLTARDDILSQLASASADTVSEKYENLLKTYFEIQTGTGSEWTMRAFADTGRLSETMAQKSGDDLAQKLRQRATTAYKKSLEQRSLSQHREALPEVLEALKHLAPEVIALTDSVGFWVAGIHDARVISVLWDSDTANLRSLFDRGLWDQLDQSIVLQEDNAKRGSLSLLKARVQAEKGQWAQARKTMEKCVDQAGDLDCMAHLLSLGYTGEKTSTFKAKLEKALLSESRVSWNMGLANLAMKQGRGKDALKIAQNAVGQDPQDPTTYSFLGRFFIENGHLELSRIVFDKGVHNTSSDETLQLEKGHVNIAYRLFDQTQILSDDLLSLNFLSGQARAFLARNRFAQADQKGEKDILKSIPDREPDKTDVLVAQFYFALKSGDIKLADDIWPKIADKTADSGSANYLAGVYLQNFKHAPHQNPRMPSGDKK